jgi:hypothetical protein
MGKGGDGLGGGLYNMGTATLSESAITGNKAKGGAADSGGLPGEAHGGGVYNDLGATLLIDALTWICGNGPDDRYDW